MFAGMKLNDVIQVQNKNNRLLQKLFEPKSGATIDSNDDKRFMLFFFVFSSNNHLNCSTVLHINFTYILWLSQA